MVSLCGGAVQERSEFEERLRQRDREEQAKRRGGGHVEEEHEALDKGLSEDKKQRLIDELRTLSEQVYVEKRGDKKLQARPLPACLLSDLAPLLFAFLAVCQWVSSPLASPSGVEYFGSLRAGGACTLRVVVARQARHPRQTLARSLHAPQCARETGGGVESRGALCLVSLAAVSRNCVGCRR